MPGFAIARRVAALERLPPDEAAEALMLPEPYIEQVRRWAERAVTEEARQVGSRAR